MDNSLFISILTQQQSRGKVFCKPDWKKQNKTKSKAKQVKATENKTTKNK